MKKLISMIDFVLNQMEINSFDDDKMKNIWNYANFLKQPLKLEMFVPCDDDGNVLEIPTKEKSNNTIEHDSKLMDYNDSKEKVIFEGFYFNFNTSEITAIIGYEIQIWFYKNGIITINSNTIKTIEHLIPYDLTLTNNAFKL